MAKQAKARVVVSTTVRAGTPNQVDSKLCEDSTQVRAFFRSKLGPHRKFAAKHNGVLASKLEVIWGEIDSFPLQKLKPGEKRRWQAVDDHSGVTFVYEIERRG